MAKRKTTTKRKPLSKKSVNIIPADENDRTPKKKTTRKKREIGDNTEYITFVQIKGSDKLHPATICKKTGGVQFTPPNRKTPIAFDSKRHKIIKKTPENPAEEEVEEETAKEKMTKKKKGETQKNGRRSRRTATAPPQTYAETSSSEAEDKEDKEEEEEEEKEILPKKRRKPPQSQASAEKKRRHSPPKSYAEESDDDDDDEKEDGKDSKRDQSVSPSSSSFRDQIFQRAAMENMVGGGGDWRTSGAIDY